MDWLPREMPLLSGSLEQDYDDLHEVFKRDFVESEVYYEGKKVYYRTSIDRTTFDGKYCVGFTHLVTRKNGGQRIIDYGRARRLPWVRAIIEHADDPAVVVLEKISFVPRRGAVRNTYLWLEEKDFLVILSCKIDDGGAGEDGQLIVTAYTITESYMRRDLESLRREKDGG